MKVEGYFQNYLDDGIEPLPAAILVLAKAISMNHATFGDGDMLAHGIIMAAREIQKQGIQIPLSVINDT